MAILYCNKCLIVALIIYLLPTDIQMQDLADNLCELKGKNGSKIYQACLTESQYLSPFNITVDPQQTTCGNPPAEFCSLSSFLGCDVCNATDPVKRRPPSYMTDRESGTTTYWQSISWSNYPEPLHINITMSFGKLYELVDDITITFHSPRPQELILEKSEDNGITWTVFQYYAKNCKSYYDQGISQSVNLTHPDAVICSQEYSSINPYTDGLVKFPVLEDRYSLFLGQSFNYKNYSTLYASFNDTRWNEFLRFTDIRVRLLYPATDGLELFGHQTDLKKYYYAISNIQVIASCHCNLHARYCLTVDGEAKCMCKHNTEGYNCERCLPLYNQQPWRPGFYLPDGTGTANECTKCDCNSHAERCIYNSVLGSGDCTEYCYHNTTGVHCERCLAGYYRNTSLPISHHDLCIDCQCEPLGVINNNTACEQNITSPILGQCPCKPLVLGQQCDRCADNYYGLFMMDNQPGVCKECSCNKYGTVNQNTKCDHSTGQCDCKHNIGQRDCSQCKDDYYGYPQDTNNATDCTPCRCDPGGARSSICDKDTGQCSCHANVESQYCNATMSGHYYSDLDTFSYKPSYTNCTEKTDMLNSTRRLFTGRYFHHCLPGDIVVFSVVGDGVLADRSFHVAIRYSLSSLRTWNGALTFSTVNDTVCNNQSLITTFLFEKGIGNSVVDMSKTVTLERGCHYKATLHVSPTPQSTYVEVDTLVLVPVIQDKILNTLESIYDVNIGDLINCTRDILSLSLKPHAKLQDTCSKLTFSIMTALYNSTLACECDPVGTIQGTECNQFGGQCHCVTGVTGRRCDQCMLGYYNFTSNGCTACDCGGKGSINPVCDEISGQCPCHTNVALFSQITSDNHTAGLQCSACLADHYGIQSSNGCLPCKCSVDGAVKSQCSREGICTCKSTIGSSKCDVCEDGFYNFTAAGCQLCLCNEVGSRNTSCDQHSGACYCKANVEGAKCSKCRSGSFHLALSNPDGCQSCFCHGLASTCTSADGFASRDVVSQSIQSWLDGAITSFKTAPNRFTTGLPHSYGQTLSIDVEAEISLRDTTIVMLLDTVGRKVLYNIPTLLLGTQKITVLLHESAWRYNGTHTPTTFEFQGILFHAQNMMVRSDAGGHSLKAENISLVTAALSDETNDHIVKHIENCTCLNSSLTEGLSCETCSVGQHRSIVNSPYSTCESCNCSGRSRTLVPECDQWTGRCLNCRNGTGGYNCSSCASHVTGSECDTCEATFWNLGRDGCEACKCHPDGSQHPGCNDVTGVCKCQPHVTGDKCDQCEQNYHNLTSTGCTECNTCYGLIMEEVTALDSQLSNLSNVILQLNAGSNMTSNFTYRLGLAVRDVQRFSMLLNTTTTAKELESDVLLLNTTITQLLSSLNEEGPTYINIGNSSIASAKNNLNQGQQLIKEINETIQDTASIIQGPIAESKATIQSITNSLKEIETSVQSKTSLQSEDIAKIEGTVEVIEERVVSLINYTKIVQQNFNSTRTGTYATSTKITTTEKYISTMQSKWKNISSQVNQLESSIRNVTSQVSSAMNLSVLAESLTVNTSDAPRQISDIISKLDDLKQRVNRSDVYGSIIQLRKELENITLSSNDVQNDLDLLLNETSGLLHKASNADTRSKAAKQLEKTTFDAARNMLEIMKQFNQKAEEVSKIANISLNLVQQVKDLSDKVTAGAKLLQSSLGAAKSLAEDAVNIAFRTRQTAIQLDEKSKVHIGRLEILKNGSKNLQNFAETKLEDTQTNVTYVTESEQKCAKEKQNIVLLKSYVQDVTSKATLVANSVSSTKQHINSISRSLGNIQQLNATEIRELVTRVKSVKSEFNQRQLKSIIDNLLTASKEQKEWLVDAKSRKDVLKNEVERLKQFRNQFP